MSTVRRCVASFSQAHLSIQHCSSTHTMAVGPAATESTKSPSNGSTPDATTYNDDSCSVQRSPNQAGILLEGLRASCSDSCYTADAAAHAGEADQPAVPLVLVPPPSPQEPRSSLWVNTAYAKATIFICSCACPRPRGPLLACQASVSTSTSSCWVGGGVFCECGRVFIWAAAVWVRAPGIGGTMHRPVAATCTCLHPELHPTELLTSFDLSLGGAGVPPALERFMSLAGSLPKVVVFITGVRAGCEQFVCHGRQYCLRLLIDGFFPWCARGCPQTGVPSDGDWLTVGLQLSLSHACLLEVVPN